MKTDQKLNFNFEVGEPKQKNNIVVFFLSSKEHTNYDLLSFPYAMKNNLAEEDTYILLLFVSKQINLNKHTLCK